MGTYAGSADFHALVYQFEETDPVHGGEDGIDNQPIKELADRTAWLKEYANDANIGMVAAFAMTAAPDGWLKANGARLSQEDYPELYSKFGNRFGQRITGPGGGSSTFTSEDRRGNVVAHGFTTGDEVRMEAFGTAITVLFGGVGLAITASTPCYVRVLTASTFSLHPSSSDAGSNLNAAQQATFTATSWATVEKVDMFKLPDMRSQFMLGLDDGLGIYSQPIGGYAAFGATGSDYYAMPMLYCVKYQ